jgi:hypothetical protein
LIFLGVDRPEEKLPAPTTGLKHRRPPGAKPSAKSRHILSAAPAIFGKASRHNLLPKFIMLI